METTEKEKTISPIITEKIRRGNYVDFCSASNEDILRELSKLAKEINQNAKNNK